MRTTFDGASLVTAECERGKMPLSRAAAAEISRTFFEQSLDVERKNPLFSASPWYCPRDGHQMCQSGKLAYECPECGRVLGGTLLRRLIELHPHERG